MHLTVVMKETSVLRAIPRITSVGIVTAPLPPSDHHRECRFAFYICSERHQSGANLSYLFI